MAIRPSSRRSTYEWREKQRRNSRFSGIGAIVNRTKLVSCRLPQDQLTECGFLEKQGFRFIELNYRPVLAGLGGFSVDPEITVCSAFPEDAKEISGFAAQIFTTGRLHVDPLVGAEIGNRRYGVWAENAFHHPDQRVLKCQMGGRTVAFMVVEQPTPASRFWSLVGLAPAWPERDSGGASGRQCSPSITARAWMKFPPASHPTMSPYITFTQNSVFVFPRPRSHSIGVHSVLWGRLRYDRS